MSDQPAVTLEQRPECLVATITASRLDEAQTRAVEADVRARAGEDRAIALVLDLGAVEHLPSVSLGSLVTISLDCHQHGQRLLLARVQQPIRDALTLTRLDKLFEIVDSVDAAATALRQSSL